MSASSYLLERARLSKDIQAVSNDSDFWRVAQKLYDFQLKYNPVFRQFALRITHSHSQHTFRFLHVSAFKSQTIKTGIWNEEAIFLSSATTGQERSRHFIRTLDGYLSNAQYIFEKSFGSVADFCFLCLLPSYLERDGSSLIAMCHDFVKKSKYSESGFFLYNHEDFYRVISHCEISGVPTVIFGVSYALLDFADKYRFEHLQHTTIIKTGGMKGRRAEMHPEELDSILKKAFGLAHICGEYGMTECLSQLYDIPGCGFAQNVRMRVVITDISDPMCVLDNGRSGRINIVDLANIDTCSFISTDDMGYIDGQNRVVILGRLDYSEMRGCNLLL